MTEPNSNEPNPGTQAAIEAGCTCPIMDNNHGRGVISQGEIVFWYTEGCPIHLLKEEEDAEI